MIRLRPRHVRARLTAWYVSVLAVLLLIYAAGTTTLFFFGLRRQLDASLLQDFEAMTHHFETEEAPWSRYVEVWTDAGLEYRSDSLRGFALGGPPSATEGAEGLVPVSLTLPNGARLRMVTGRYARVERGETIGRGRDALMRLAHSEEKLWHDLGELVTVIALGSPLALGAAGLGGYLLARRALAPIEAMTRQAARISAERLGERLPVDNPDDELGQLAWVLNESLDRLEAAFGELRRFTADASHELRTPLAAVRSVGEVALQRDHAPEEYREAIGSMLEEVDRLSRLVDSLLLLSRADAGPVPLARTRLPVEDVVKEALSVVEVLAEEKAQELKLDVDPSLVIGVDRLILRQALVNVLDNAIKYSPPASTVRVGMGRRGENEIVVEVTDEGPGIPPEHRSRVFERFYRVDGARARPDGGAGLGLAIADWAVRAHGGFIEVDSGTGGGSRFRIVLPAAGIGSEP